MDTREKSDMSGFEMYVSDEQSDTRDTQLTKMYEYAARNKKGPEGPFLFCCQL